MLTIIRVHAGTRILIRSLGRSCCPGPGASIAFALTKKDERKDDGQGQWYPTPICRQVVLLSHFKEASVFTGKIVRVNDLGRYTDEITVPNVRARVSDRIPESLLAQGSRSLGTGCSCYDLALTENTPGHGCAEED